MDGLGCQSQMAAYGYIMRYQMIYRFNLVMTSFQFDNLGTTFTDQPGRVTERLGRGRVTHERHITYNNGALSPSLDLLQVVDHIPCFYLECGFITMQNHTQ